jgi:hypothetical protein
VLIACKIALLLMASSAFGQVVIDRSRVPREWQDFRPLKDEAKLQCSVSPVKPGLNYSFRFQTGYVVRVPLRQYEGAAQRLFTFFRVTPENSEREPVYFVSSAQIPEAPRTNVTVEFGGGYVVGEGKYRVDWVLADESGRVCAKNWRINAKLGRKERDLPPGMAAGTVDQISLRRWTRGSRGPNDPQGHRITILMNAAPVMTRRIQLGGYDRILLLSSLASLVERLPLRSARLVVFNLDQQREIYRTENFEPADFSRVARALSELELGVVDYDVLKNRRGHVDLVAELIGESLENRRSDAVVFLGPKPRHLDKVQRSLLPERSPDHPPFFYVQFRPFIIGASYPDTLMNAVSQMKGKTFQVYSPGDFAEAILDITKALEQSKRSGAAAGAISGFLSRPRHPGRSDSPSRIRRSSALRRASGSSA